MNSPTAANGGLPGTRGCPALSCVPGMSDSSGVKVPCPTGTVFKVQEYGGVSSSRTAWIPLNLLTSGRFHLQRPAHSDLLLTGSACLARQPSTAKGSGSCDKEEKCYFSVAYGLASRFLLFSDQESTIST